MIFTGKNINKVIESLKKIYDETFKNHGMLHYFLGEKVCQEKDGIFISQKKYIDELLSKFKIFGCKSVETPLVGRQKFQKNDGVKKFDLVLLKSLVSSLLYLTATRPDIIFATN